MNDAVLRDAMVSALAVGTVLATMPARADDDIQSVVVTAQSRRQLAQDVPIAMQVVTQKDIANVGAKDLGDLNGYLPGLVVDNTEPTQPSFGIRGVQPADFGIATDAPVGIYVDGVYTGKTGGALMNFIDVQRIEVVKGPQGTLFGRNSAAGAIAIVSNEPGMEVDALAHVKFGSFGRANADAMLNLPLTDDSALRFVLVHTGSEGWVTNQGNGEQADGDHDWATRIAYRKDWGASRLVLSVEHEQLNQGGRAAFGVVKNPALPLGGYTGVYNAAYTANFVDPFTAPLQNDVAGQESRHFDGATARVEVPLGGDIGFQSITAYRRFGTHDYTDNDGGNRPDLYLATLDAKVAHNWQQEFKLSGRDARLDWIAGASFYGNHETQDTGAYINTATIDTLSQFAGGGASFTRLFGGLGALVPGLGAATVLPWEEHQYSTVRTKSLSAYGDTIWHIGARSNFTAGLRWTRDEKSMTWDVPGRTSPQLDDLLNSYGALAGLTPASLPANVVFAAAGQLAAAPVTRSKDWTDVSPRLVLDHKLNPGTLLYVSLSRGYQAGGFNVFTPPNPASPVASSRDPSFAPEKMSNLELGVKLALPSIGATVNASLFGYQFKNLQDIELYSVGSIPTYNVTSSDQRAHGLDLDGRVRISPRVTAFGGMEYIDQNYTRYQRLDSAGNVSLDLGGQPVGTPYLTAMAGVNVSWSALDGRGSLNFQGTHQGATRCNADTAALSCLSTANLRTGTATSKFDLRLGWDRSDRRFGVALLVNNVFDQRYVTKLDGQSKQYGMPYAYVTPPRAYGVELRGSM